MAKQPLFLNIRYADRDLRHLLALIETAAADHGVTLTEADLPTPMFTVTSEQGHHELVVTLQPKPGLYALLGAIGAGAIEDYRRRRAARATAPDEGLSAWDAWWRIRSPSPPSADQQTPVATLPASGLPASLGT